ncbi:hypothetical protein APHAL10511_000030 [Amanita phalloides]|nr:hypothetical protein APHAL10511_000030 [Amanita phalloides]
MSTSLEKKGMPYIRLGNSGLKVSKIILGCMSFGTPDTEKWLMPEGESLKLIKAAYDAGINTFDTANVYSFGQSEVILGKAIKEFNIPREEIVIMTKVYLPMTRPALFALLNGENPDDIGSANQYGLSRKHIFDSVKASLKRLQLDYVDVLQCHRFDKNTPIEETMQALHDVVKAGYVRYIGMSSCWAWQFHAMQNYAIANKLTPFISMQNHYSLLYREEEREMFPTLKHFGVGSIPWSPLARGILARPAHVKTKRGETDRQISRLAPIEADETNVIIERVQEIANKKDISMAQVALAWIMAKDAVAAPIVGTSSMDNLKDIIKSVQVTLTDEEVRYLEEPYRPRNIIGHS